MRRYKVLYGDYTGSAVMGKNLSKKDAEKLYELINNKDSYMLTRIEEYEEFDIKEDRKKKLEKLKEKYL